MHRYLHPFHHATYTLTTTEKKKWKIYKPSEQGLTIDSVSGSPLRHCVTNYSLAAWSTCRKWPPPLSQGDRSTLWPDWPVNHMPPYKRQTVYANRPSLHTLLTSALPVQLDRPIVRASIQYPSSLYRQSGDKMQMTSLDLVTHFPRLNWHKWMSLYTIYCWVQKTPHSG